MNLLRTIIFLSSFSILIGQSWMQKQRFDRKFNQSISNYDQGKYENCEVLLKEILSENPGVYKEPSLLLLFKAQIGLNKFENARQSAKQFLSDFPESDYLPNVMNSLGDLSVKEGIFSSAYRFYHRALDLSQDNLLNEKIHKKLYKVIQYELPISLIEELTIMSKSIESQNIHLIAAANISILNGRPDDAALSLSKIKSNSLPEIYIPFFENLLKASYRSPASSLTIGLVLPLTGSQSEIGNAFLNGFIEGEKSGVLNGNRLSTIINDTKSENLHAVNISKKLEQRNQILGIVLQVDQEATLAITSVLSSTDIPVILSEYRFNDLSKIHSQTFLTHSTIAIDAKNSANYAVNSLGLDSIAVIAPADEYGEIQVDAFIKEVNRLGANVVATVWYTGEPKNLRRQFKYLRKVAFDLLNEKEDFDEALGMEIDSLDALFDVSIDDYFDLPSTKKQKMSSSDSAKVVLETLQGIYLPIRDGEVEFLGTQLPMYNLKAKIIGNLNWKNLDILKKENIGPHLKGLSIIADFYNTSNDTLYNNSKLNNAYYRGFNTAQLLTSLNIQDAKRVTLAKVLSSLNTSVSKGYYYSTASNNKINSASQLFEFDGNKFIHKGTFISDSLLTIINQD